MSIIVTLERNLPSTASLSTPLLGPFASRKHRYIHPRIHPYVNVADPKNLYYSRACDIGLAIAVSTHILGLCQAAYR